MRFNMYPRLGAVALVGLLSCAQIAFGQAARGGIGTGGGGFGTRGGIGTGSGLAPALGGAGTPIGSGTGGFTVYAPRGIGHFIPDGVGGGRVYYPDGTSAQVLPDPAGVSVRREGQGRQSNEEGPANWPGRY